MQCEYPFARKICINSRFGCGIHHGLGQSRQIFFIVDDKAVDISFFEDVVGILQGEQGGFFVDLAQAFLLTLVQSSSRAYKIFVVFFEQTLLFCVQIQIGSVFVEAFDAFKEQGIQSNIVFVFRKQRAQFLSNGLHLVVGMAGS